MSLENYSFKEMATLSNNNSRNLISKANTAPLNKEVFLLERGRVLNEVSGALGACNEVSVLKGSHLSPLPNLTSAMNS